MNNTDIARAIDIHRFLDKLEEASDIQNYYRINHLSPTQREQLAEKMAETLADELIRLGLKIDAER
ncbi:MAG: hypothetical protein ACOYXC_09660 [Candidatus Rifleibacteriota bacterium]